MGCLTLAGTHRCLVVVPVHGCLLSLSPSGDRAGRRDCRCRKSDRTRVITTLSFRSCGRLLSVADSRRATEIVGGILGGKSGASLTACALADQSPRFERWELMAAASSNLCCSEAARIFTYGPDLSSWTSNSKLCIRRAPATARHAL